MTQSRSSFCAFNNFTKNCFRASLLLSAGISTLAIGQTAFAQDVPQDEVVVTGIRQSLESALVEKRQADSLVEVILAEDIGKLPDQNLAEVLENVTGIQITRTAGIGTGVQIRGTNANRTEINGVSTVGSGSGRSGISFEDVPAAMIAGVEVTKAPLAKTIEGSVGGTINLRTIRPLDLKEDDFLASVRIQGEDSSLSTDGIKPRLSGTLGKKWSNASGQEIGAVFSVSYTEQDVTAFRPRADRDNLVESTSGAASAQSFDFLPIQFLIQDYDNYEYETLNFSGSLEARPSDNIKLYFDAVVNDQQRREESSRVQASGVSDLRNFSIPTEFETVDFGSLEGQTLGSMQAAARGIIPIETGGGDPNLRFSSDTGSRLTDSEIFRLGTDWEHGRFSGRLELSTSSSDSTTPDFSTTLNFINPNAATNSSNENGTPFEYDLTGGSLTFGVAQGAAGGPTTAQLLDPANVVLRDVNIAQSKAENSEDAFRADFTYDFSDNNTVGNFISSIDAGYRYSKSESLRDEITSSVGLRTFAESPTGNLFSDILIAGPDNFNAADGRTLYVPDFLLVNPELVASDPQSVLATINAAIAAHNGITGSSRGPISSPTSSQSAFFDVVEKTNAFYAQANFDYGVLRGNAGLRYLETDVTSNGNAVLNGVATPTTTKNSYDYVLPRINLIADLRDDLVLRAGWSKDIRRPDYDNLSTSFTFETSPNPDVSLGNPALSPEEVQSFDVSAEWYFAPSALLSVGFFHKKRNDVFSVNNESPVEDPITGYRDITAPCEGGGIFNPIADINVFGPNAGVGVCVPSSQVINGAGTTTQKGVEVALQYDFSAFEDKLGSFSWASGFGVLANYTYQDFSGNDEYYTPTSRAAQVFGANGATNVQLQQGAIDLSNNAYNATLYYEKYGLSARARYTWRSAYRSDDFGSTSSYPWGFPVIQEARGQLNASINYDVTEKLNVGVEAVNLTKSDVTQSCVNSGSLLCFQGLTDRRIIFGASYNF